LLLLACAPPSALAQEASEPAAALVAARSCVDGVRPITAFELLKRTIGERARHERALPSAFREELAADLSVSLYGDGPPSGTRLHLRVAEAGRRGAIAWQQVTFVAAAFPQPRPAAPPPDDAPRAAAAPLPFDAVPVRAERYQPADPAEAERLARTGGVVVAVNRPDAAGWRMAEDWVAVVAVCDDKQLVAYAEMPFTLYSGHWAIGLALLVVLALYLVAAWASAALHRGRLDAASAARGAGAPEAGGAGALWRAVRALDPVFVTQDATGAASLARLQLLLFTLAVSGVYTYVFVRTGSLATMSQSVLLLLGIAVVGGGLARITGDRATLSTFNRIWLTARGVLRPVQGPPQWRDLVTAGGEVDLSRLQAIAFSGFAVVALVVSGPADLSSFVVPEQLLWLIGVSQAVYVAGRAVPPETVRRANQEMDALRAAERAADETRQRGDPAAAETARAGFLQARAALAVTLADVLGERFDEAALARAAPG
jgi:hypothetical protein